jgi:hypothetical protein
MAKVSKSDIESFTKEEVSNIYEAALELGLDEGHDEKEWWGNYAPVFNVAKCWLGGDKDKAVQLVHHTSLHLLDWVCEKFCDEGWDWDDVMLSANYEGFTDKMPNSKFRELLKAMEEALKRANLNLYTVSTLDRFREFPLLSSQGSVVEGIACFAEGTIDCGGAHFSGIALDSDLDKESIFICRNFSEVRTGFDCYAALFRIEHTDFPAPIGYVVKTYGPWSASFFGGGFVEAVGECIDNSDEPMLPVLVLDGIQRATEINKPFVVTQKLGVTAGSLTIDDDQLEVDFQSDEIATYMPGTYRTYALNTDYAEITFDDKGYIDWNESATLFINEKALEILGLSAK